MKKLIINAVVAAGIILLGSVPVLNASSTEENTESQVETQIAPIEETGITESEENSEEIPFQSVEGEKTNEDPGTETIIIKEAGEKATGEYYTCDGEITAEKAEDCETLTVTEGEITNVDEGIFITNGGTEKIIDLYPTVEDITNANQPIPVSGAGFDGQYISTKEVNGEEYAEVLISGRYGFIKLADITIIPSSMVLANTHYESVGGVWTLFEAVDPLNSEEYSEFPLGDAPDWAVEGKKYTSYDDTNFYETVEKAVEEAPADQSEVQVYRSSVSSSLTATSYFQNLPFRSASGYTAAQYKNYLKSKGQTSGEYYNYTSSFIDAQSLEYVNSTLLFALANHESAYGTSTFAQRCNNFFGRGAYDSNPANACQEYGYTTPKDGILAQAVFLTTGYFDIKDYRYAGDHFGNKNSGINVYYASDPNWGQKNASHAYQIDNYLGGKEKNKYKIVKQTASSHTAYKEAGLNTPLKVQAYNNSVGNYAMSGANDGVNFLVRSEGSGYYEIQLPTPLNVSSSTTCQYTTSKKGSYPKYNGYKAVSVAKGMGNYACKYGSWSAQKAYVTKSGTTVLNNVKIVKPESISGNTNDDTSDTCSGGLTTKKTYYSTKVLRYETFIDCNNNVIYAKVYNEKGKLTNYYEYFSGTKYGSHSNKIQYKLYVDSKGYVTYGERRTTAQKIDKYYEYTAGTKYGQQGKRRKYEVYMNTDNTIKYARRLNSSGTVDLYHEYPNGVTYAKRSGKIKYKLYVNTSTGYLRYGARYTNGKIDKYYEYTAGTKYGQQGKRIKYEVYMKSDDTMKYGRRLTSTGKVDKYYHYASGTRYANRSGKIRTEFYMDTRTNYVKYAYDIDSKRNKIYKYTYKPKTTYWNYQTRVVSKTRV